MTRRRWIADEISGNRAALTGPHAEHLTRVLRARVGEEFDVAAEGHLHRARIVSISDQRVEFELGGEISSPPAVDLSLLLSIFKFDRMEWAIEKCTELGVSRVIPAIAQRTDSHLAAAAAKRVERWRRITREASEQSRRVQPPEVLAPIRLEDFLKDESRMPGPGSRIVLSEVETGVMLREIPAILGAAAVAIGPEGGWAARELELFQKAGWTAASLGGTILRAETAAIAAVAVLQS